MTKPAQIKNFRKGFAAGLIYWLASTSFGVAQPAMLAPPPRTIVDITAILDQQKPDSERTSRAQAAVDATRPETADALALVAFYLRRGDARSELGRLSEAIADLHEGIAIGHENGVDVTRLRILLGYLYSWSGDNKSALQSFLTSAQENEKPDTELSLIFCYRGLSQVYIYLGDLVHAEKYVKKNDALFARKLPLLGDNKFRDLYAREVHFGRGRLFEARGQYREAEEQYQLANDLTQQLVSSIAGGASATFLSNQATARDNLIASGGRVKARQGRFAEGEADARQALLNRLSSVGKYNLTTTRTIPYLSAILIDGEVAFAAIPVTRREIESKVRRLREALEPNAAMISDIPAFDVALGYELYSSLLRPVEGGWKKAQHLIVVTNGALGLLPLSLLSTAPAKIDTNDDPLFSSYRAVPWLARKYAVTTVPSSAALRTLRQLPPGKPGRGELIAFGDPLFSAEQAAEAANAETAIMVADAGMATTRGMPLKRRSIPKLEGINSAELAMLPRLPDTADELKSTAVALQADPSKVLKLGKNANENVVKTMDLSQIKVLAFATHGLVPGELNGLTQPALALSAPSVAGVEGDGLLTMVEILALKLDADWVVLSACNTGAGAGGGAEAASGLGLAFFYAGTRAVLVTNWSVHSQSARELVTDLFKRQADDPKLARGEALRQAMMALADGPGYVGADGKTEFAYAHPLFWAPYSIIGDGGAR